MNANKNQGGTATEQKPDERNRDRNQGGSSQGDGWKQGSDPNRRPDQPQPRSDEKKVPGLDEETRRRQNPDQERPTDEP